LLNTQKDNNKGCSKIRNPYLLQCSRTAYQYSYVG